MDKRKENSPDITLEKLIKGDRDEFALFVELYSPRIYRLAVKILNNEQDAEDVLQETFLKAMRGLASFEGRSSLSTWLYRIATNEALMLLRKRHPEAISIDAPVEGDEEDNETLEIVDWSHQPESELLEKETRQKIDRAASELPIGLREVFMLRELEGLSVRETAEVLEVSESVVKTRLLRARMKLRQVLTNYFVEKKRKEVAGG